MRVQTVPVCRAGKTVNKMLQVLALKLHFDNTKTFHLKDGSLHLPENSNV